MRVRFNGASDIQRKWAGSTGDYLFLEPEHLYDVEAVDVHSRHTRVYIAGHEGWFNSVCFTIVLAEREEYERLGGYFATEPSLEGQMVSDERSN